MKHDDHTDMGGVGRAFLTTRWTLIEDIRRGSDSRDALIGALLKAYWKPVYSFLRRHGHNNEDAKDLTQSFFYDIVLSNQLFQQADSCKGRFRTFLLTALRRYLINVKRKETARKRTPKGKMIPLDVVDPNALGVYSEDLSPDECFNCAWVSSLLEHVFADVEAACHQDGKTVHWKVFDERVLQPLMDQTEAPPVKDICRKYDLTDGHMLANMITTTKRRIRLALEKHIQDLVSSPDEVVDELQELTRFFPSIAQNL